MDLMPSHTASFPIHCASFIGHIYYWVKLFTISDIRPIYLWQKITVGKLHSILILFRRDMLSCGAIVLFINIMVKSFGISL
jgi:hypothetical protein